MKLNKIIVTGMAAVIVLAMAGCGGATGAATSEGETAVMASTEGFTVEDGPMTTAAEAMTGPSVENVNSGSALEFAGAYSEETGKGYSLLITPTDDETGVYVTVGYMNEEEQVYYIWDILGEVENKVIAYSGAVCTKMIPDDQAQTGVREELVYNDGEGTMEISEDGKITWKDERVNNGEELVLAWDQELNDELQEQAQTGMN